MAVNGNLQESGFSELPEPRGPAGQRRADTRRWLLSAVAGVLVVTTAVWAYGFSRFQLQPQPGEFWLYLLFFLFPAGVLGASLWVLLSRELWRILTGIICVLPSLAIWLLSLLLVANGFNSR